MKNEIDARLAVDLEDEGAVRALVEVVRKQSSSCCVALKIVENGFQ